MAQPPSRTFVGVVFGCCLMASAPASAHGLHFGHASVKELSFVKLAGWRQDDLATAFSAYMKSCGAILHGTKAMRKARPMYGGLYRACEKGAALAARGTVDTAKARKFFEENFRPVRIMPEMHTYGFYTGADGFYTGYYETQIDGSRIKTADYTIPLYGVPPKYAGKRSVVYSQYSRAEIESGALEGKDLAICYVKNPVDAFFAQIQGSTRIKLRDGQLLRLNYIASNGKPYTPVGRILIEEGVYTPEEMSMEKIRQYMEAYPEKGKELREKNRSYVFFSKAELKPTDECIGAQGIPLTPWRSIAVDPTHHVYGSPIWIDADLPLKSAAPVDPFRHLMIAQDTGSAIRGVARADIYFGHGEQATAIAGRLKQWGKFVMLVPNGVSVEGEPVPRIPLPRPRPKQIAVHEALAQGQPAVPTRPHR
jgi:membrane-bound lytic murein transglycosylase A